MSDAGSKAAVEIPQAAIAWVRDNFGFFPNPARAGFRRFLRESARRTFVTRKPKKALPLLLLRKLLSFLLRDPPSALHLRLAAVVALMFHGFLRITETLAMCVQNVSWSKHCVILTVCNGKGNVYRDPCKVPIPKLTGSAHCPVYILQQYFDVVDLWNVSRTTPLFPRLRSDPGGHSALSVAVSVSTIRSQLKRAIHDVGDDPLEYSTHSLRAGGASEALNRGVPIERVRKHGRWSSFTSCAGYWEEQPEDRAAVSKFD